MKKQEKIYRELDSHFNELIDELDGLDSELIINDEVYRDLVVRPSYISLASSIKGLNIYVTESNKRHEEICEKVREEILEVKDGKVNIKIGKSELIAGIIRDKIGSNLLSNGIKRYLLNAVMNVFLTISYLVMYSLIALHIKSLITPPYIPLVAASIVGLIIVTILIAMYKMGLKLPHSPEDNKFKLIHLGFTILPTCTVPFLFLGDWAIYLLFGVLCLSLFVIMFLKHAGMDIIISSKYDKNEVLVKRLAIAFITMLIAVYFQLKSSFADDTLYTVFVASIYGYIAGGLVMSFFVMRKYMNRAKDSLPLGEFATEEEKKNEEDEQRRMDDILRAEGRAPAGIILGGTETDRKNQEAILTRVLFYGVWLVLFGIIGCLLIPYYIYLIIKPKVVVIDRDVADKI